MMVYCLIDIVSFSNDQFQEAVIDSIFFVFSTLLFELTILWLLYYWQFGVLYYVIPMFPIFWLDEHYHQIIACITHQHWFFRLDF